MTVDKAHDMVADIYISCLLYLLHLLNVWVFLFNIWSMQTDGAIHAMTSSGSVYAHI